MHYFFCENIGDLKKTELNEQESHHAIHVLRLKPGHEIMLLDGIGNKYEAEIGHITKKKAEVLIRKKIKTQKTRPYYLHIAIGPVKSSDRFDFFLEKATEIGIDEITPVISQNSERRKINRDKLNQTLISAIKQSGNAFLPVLNHEIDFSQFIRSQQKFTGNKIICHCLPGDKTHLLKSGDLKQAMVLIGPEGDFTRDEVNLAIEANFIAAGLGEERLRTETAGLFVCSMIKTFHLLQ